MSDKLSDALAKFNTTMDHLGGCTDGGCVIKRPAGMHTNGGCRCPQDKMKMQRAMYAANGLRDAVAAALAASPAPAISESEDAARLDFLDAMNARKNEKNGTRYGWRLSENHNRIALEDHAWPAVSVREAIDAARKGEKS
ncbi:hypothetical protein [Burkholderia gladioli]|uniref:hypothetical protein n=1 Tax=Burkholderia gladioli TaxID=28095 RepID=UPI00163FC0C0|nr:hypothetical protein [Burkholderia gladioli]